MSGSYHDYTLERLQALYPFSKKTTEWVATRAAKQQTLKTYEALFAYVGVPDPALHIAKNGDGVPYIDIPAKAKHQKGVLVVHVSIGNPLDPNQLYQTAAIADINPEYRVIAFGNPSGKPYHVAEQKLSFKKWFSIAFTKNVRPLVHAELDYLASQNIIETTQIGFSYGALKAAIESCEQPAGSVKQIIIVDPASHPRNPIRLVRDFMRTYTPLGEYINRVESKTFHEARGDSARMRDYAKTYLRPVNMAIGILLSKASIITWLQRAIGRNPDVRITVAWGTQSELSNDAQLRADLQEVAKTKKQTIQTMPIQNQKHAFANDIYLHAAIIREALV